MKKEDALKIKKLYDKNEYDIMINSCYVDGFVHSMEIADEEIAKEYSCNGVNVGDVFVRTDSLACSLERFRLGEVRSYKEFNIQELIK